MGVVVNKSFRQIQKSVANKGQKLFRLLEEHNGTLWGEWTRTQDRFYERLATLCYEVVEEIDNLEEIVLPEYEKSIK